MVPIDGPEHNMYMSSFKLSICDRRAERTVKERDEGLKFTVLHATDSPHTPLPHMRK